MHFPQFCLNHYRQKKFEKMTDSNCPLGYFCEGSVINFGKMDRIGKKEEIIWDILPLILLFLEAFQFSICSLFLEILLSFVKMSSPCSFWKLFGLFCLSFVVFMPLRQYERTIFAIEFLGYFSGAFLFFFWKSFTVKRERTHHPAPEQERIHHHPPEIFEEPPSPIRGIIGRNMRAALADMRLTPTPDPPQTRINRELRALGIQNQGDVDQILQQPRRILRQRF